jgi:SAM-dependent methyltransferase
VLKRFQTEFSATMAHGIGTPFSARERSRDAWTAFWQEPGQSRCVADAPDIATLLDGHWSWFASSLQANARVLDLGCGAGAVGRALLAARRDVHVTGVDFARVPLRLQPHLELLSDTAMESLPFADASFAAATSQFGFEYADTGTSAAEMARVLAPRAPFSFLVHHAGSAIVAGERARLTALRAALESEMRATFCAGDASFTSRISALKNAHPHDALIAELARTLPMRLARPPRERHALWIAVEDALAPELCLAEALTSCCVAPEDLDRWTAALRSACELTSVSILHDLQGAPVAWVIEGAVMPG